jgi:hypothetical protein
VIQTGKNYSDCRKMDAYKKKQNRRRAKQGGGGRSMASLQSGQKKLRFLLKENKTKNTPEGLEA